MDDENMDDEKMMDEKMEDGESMDDEAKAYVPTLDGAGVEIGEPADRIVIDNGRPKHLICQLLRHLTTMNLETLDLSVGNIEKAYEAFRQEQLEKLAYDNLQKSLRQRFENEVFEERMLSQSRNYDAQSEIASLKDEFTELRKSLTAERETI